MKQNKFIRKCLSAALCAMLAAASVPCATAFADEAGPCTLRIEYADEGRMLSGAQFRVYRTADVLPHGEYALAGQFADCQVTFGTQMTNAEWVDAAEALQGHAEENGIQPDYTGRTDSDGSIVLGGLQEGLYLVEGSRVTKGSTSYTPQAFCVVLPGKADGNVSVYDVTVEPKFTTNYRPVPNEPNTPKPTEPVQPTVPTEQFEDNPTPLNPFTSLGKILANWDGAQHIAQKLKDKFPKAGEDMLMACCMAAIGLSAAGIVVLVATGRKKKGQSPHLTQLR